ncbi:Lysophospholipase L1, partial [Candidatus Electrothrix marina]
MTGKMTILFLMGLLAVSLLFNYVLYKQGKQFYLQLNADRLDPVGLSVYPATSPNHQKEKSKAKRIVFLGDSRIADWTQPEITGYEIFNRGIGGQTSAQTLMRYDAHVMPLAPDIILIQAGVNDLKTIALFPEQRDRILSDVQKNLHEITRKAVDQGATVILTTIFPVGKVPLERRPFWSEDVESALIEANAFIFSLQDEHVVIFDAYSILVSKNGKIQPQYSRDLLHLNKQGYAVLNRELEQFFARLPLS